MKLLCVFMIVMAALATTPGLWAQQTTDANPPCPIYDASGRVMPADQGPYYHCQGGPWTPGPSTDDVTLSMIGTAPGPMYNTMSGGDSDGDGLFEIYMYIGIGSTFTYRGYERVNGGSTYTQAFQNANGLIPYAYGEVDGDNLPDVVGQWSSWVYVYESPALGQYANSLVWQSPSIPNVTGYTAIGDLDRDGHQEIIQSWNTFGSDNRLVIWENTGDNQFQQIYSQPISNSNTGQKAIADFDGDGLMEMALSSGNGDVYVYESPADNTFQQTYHSNMGTYNAYACVLAHDMDGNGRPEFIVGGSDSNQGWVTKIYEAAGNDSIRVRQTIIINDNYFGVPGVCAGDFNGDGRDEFIIQTAQALHVFQWSATAQRYVQVQNVPENFGPILHGIFAYDSNNDGRDEVFWLGIDYADNSIILEDQTGFPQLDVNLALHPPQIPPHINFDASVVNHGPNQAPFWVWGRLRYPDGTYSAINLGPAQLNPPVGITVTRFRTLTYSATWPPGMYAQLGYAGWGVGFPVDTDSITFTLNGQGGGPVASTPFCQGELFPGEESHSLPTTDGLIEATPNPFNPTTAISYQLSAFSHVSLQVYDNAGRLIQTLVNDWQDIGRHQATFNGSNSASGMYIYTLKIGSNAISGKLVLMK